MNSKQHAASWQGEIEDTDERGLIESLGKRDLQDHLERYEFAKSIAKGKVLDIACGTGYGTAMLREAGHSVVGMDVSAEAVNYAKSNYGGEYVQGSMIHPTGGPYDTVVSFETIEHVDDYRAALAGLRGCLSQNGTLVLSTPHRTVSAPECQSVDDKPKNPFHIREFTFNEMAEELRLAGFTIAGTYGQRQRRLIGWRPFALLYGALAQLGLIPGHYDSRVLPLKEGLHPRYVVFVCQLTG